MPRKEGSRISTADSTIPNWIFYKSERCYPSEVRRRGEPDDRVPELKRHLQLLLGARAESRETDSGNLHGGEAGGRRVRMERVVKYRVE